MNTEDKEQMPLERQPLLKRLRFQAKDIVTYIIYLVLGAYILYSLGASIYTNYQSQQDIKAAEDRITELKMEKERLKSLLVYYNTKSYQEIELRRRLLLKRPGETVVALKSDKPLSQIFVQENEEEPKSPWQEWYEYYFKPQ